MVLGYILSKYNYTCMIYANCKGSQIKESKVQGTHKMGPIKKATVGWPPRWVALRRTIYHYITHHFNCGLPFFHVVFTSKFRPQRKAKIPTRSVYNYPHFVAEISKLPLALLQGWHWSSLDVIGCHSPCDRVENWCDINWLWCRKALVSF